MNKSVKNSDIEIYGYNSINRYDFFADKDFSISQHMLVKNRDENNVHTHSYYEMEIILYGDVYEVVNRNKYITKPEGFVFLSPSELHNVELIDDETILLCIKIKHEMFTPKIQRILKSVNFPLLGEMKEEEYKFIGECIEKIEKIKETIKEYDLLREIVMKMLEALVIYVICRYDNEHYNSLIDLKNDQMINAIIYVRENYDKNINMKSVSEKIGYSYNYFGNRFKEITGQNFISYLNDIRLSQAYNKLMLGDDPVESVCENVGFGNISYFYRKFNEKYKCTPGQLRKEKESAQKNGKLKREEEKHEG